MVAASVSERDFFNPIQDDDEEKRLVPPHTTHTAFKRMTHVLSSAHLAEQVTSASPTERTDDKKPPPERHSTVSRTGLRVLLLLVLQTCVKNVLMQVVMKERPKFLLSTAVITAQLLKLVFSATYIRFGLQQSVWSILTVLRDDWYNTLLLIIPCAAYSLVMTLEYVAFANMDASVFQVLVQMKMPITALFYRTVLGKKLQLQQLLSLVILTAGVMLCNLPTYGAETREHGDTATGVSATLAIATCSGFASVFTEKVIKAARKTDVVHSLAHVQAQMALVSLCILGCYAVVKDFQIILEQGFLYEFNFFAFLSCLNSAIGGLIVAAVLSYSDSVLKGYAGAVSIVITGICSVVLFDTSLSACYGMGVVNIICAMILYNASDLDGVLC